MRSSERPPRGGLGRLVWRAAALTLAGFLALAILPLTVTLVAVTAIPLATLLAGRASRTRAETMTLAGCVGFALWWLLQLGELPGQLTRAAAIFAALAFVTATRWTRLTVTHRALTAAAVAIGGVTALLFALGSSWSELRWWVEFRVGLAARSVIGGLWTVSASAGGGQITDPGKIETLLHSAVSLAAAFYPALTVLVILTGLALASRTYHWVAPAPKGVGPGRFKDFRFSEHLGWAVIIPLVVVLIPKLAAAKTAAANVLLVAAVFYGLRGVAVAAFLAEMAGGVGFLLSALLAVIMFVMLPVVAGGAVVLGVLDTGVDFRRRLKIRPPASN